MSLASSGRRYAHLLASPSGDASGIRWIRERLPGRGLSPGVTATVPLPPKQGFTRWMSPPCWRLLGRQHLDGFFFWAMKPQVLFSDPGPGGVTAGTSESLISKRSGAAAGLEFPSSLRQRAESIEGLTPGHGWKWHRLPGLIESRSAVTAQRPRPLQPPPVSENRGQHGAPKVEPSLRFSLKERLG